MKFTAREERNKEIKAREGRKEGRKQGTKRNKCVKDEISNK
jgi:hypothetical protein